MKVKIYILQCLLQATAGFSLILWVQFRLEQEKRRAGSHLSVSHLPDIENQICVNINITAHHTGHNELHAQASMDASSCCLLRKSDGTEPGHGITPRSAVLFSRRDAFARPSWDHFCLQQLFAIRWYSSPDHWFPLGPWWWKIDRLSNLNGLQ